MKWIRWIKWCYSKVKVSDSPPPDLVFGCVHFYPLFIFSGEYTACKMMPNSTADIASDKLQSPVPGWLWKTWMLTSKSSQTQRNMLNMERQKEKKPWVLKVPNSDPGYVLFPDILRFGRSHWNRRLMRDLQRPAKTCKDLQRSAEICRDLVIQTESWLDAVRCEPEVELWWPVSIDRLFCTFFFFQTRKAWVWDEQQSYWYLCECWQTQRNHDMGRGHLCQDESAQLSSEWRC